MFYEAFVRAAARLEQFAIVATTDDRPEAARTAAKTLRQRGVDALVLTTARDDDNFTEELEKQGIPFVLALRTDGRSSSSLGDDHLGGYLATRHLIDLGHTRIGVIAGPEYASSARQRKMGYQAAMNEAGLHIDADWIAPSTFNIDSGSAAGEHLMKLERRPTAIFAVSDHLAMGAMSAILRQGMSVPNDVSLVGYNDIPLVSHLSTPLSTVRVPFDQIASQALDLLSGGAPGDSNTRIATPSLIPRQSSVRKI